MGRVTLGPKNLAHWLISQLEDVLLQNGHEVDRNLVPVLVLL